MTDPKTYLDPAEEKMEMAVMYLDETLQRIRAGKANPKILDGIRVDYYGSQAPISNVANVSVPDARTIAITPWEKSMFKEIEKAIINSDLGITPENNGEVIRIGIPPLTEERRKQLVKQCKTATPSRGLKRPSSRACPRTWRRMPRPQPRKSTTNISNASTRFSPQKRKRFSPCDHHVAATYGNQPYTNRSVSWHRNAVARFRLY